MRKQREDLKKIIYVRFIERRKQITQEERIKKLEAELAGLREEVKKTRKANVWKKVKENFRTELESFNWVHEHSFTNVNGERIESNRNMRETEHISQAIGTIVRVVLKRKGISWLEDEDKEKAMKITEEILKIMENERRNKNEKPKEKHIKETT